MTFISNIIYQTCQLFLGSCWTFVFTVSTGQEIILFIQYVAILDLHFFVVVVLNLFLSLSSP